MLLFDFFDLDEVIEMQNIECHKGVCVEKGVMQSALVGLRDSVGEIEYQLVRGRLHD